MSSGGYSVVTIGERMTDSDSLELERHLIAELRLSGAKIANIHAGGQGKTGYIAPPCVREKQRVAKLGRKQSPDHAAKSSTARIGHKNTPEAIEKTMQARRRPVKSSDGITYKSSRDAARAMQELHGGGFSQGNISSAVSGRIKTAYGLEWSYAD
jgi:hypothetical protein